MFIGEKRSPVTVLLLSIITCGIYGLYWFYTIGKEINAALGREAVNPTMCIIGIFCFPVLIYYAYTIDKALEELAPARGVNYSSNFVLWIITMLLGIGFLIVYIQVQSTLNDIWDSSMNMAAAANNNANNGNQL